MGCSRFIKSSKIGISSNNIFAINVLECTAKYKYNLVIATGYINLLYNIYIRMSELDSISKMSMSYL